MVAEFTYASGRPDYTFGRSAGHVAEEQLLDWGNTPEGFYYHLVSEAKRRAPRRRPYDPRDHWLWRTVLANWLALPEEQRELLMDIWWHGR